MRIFYVSILALVFFTCCSKDSSNAPAQNPSFDAEAAARKVFLNFNAHNWKAMADCYADTALFLDPSLGNYPTPQTRAQTIAKYTSLQQSIPNINDSVINVFANGDKAVVEFISTGTLPGGGKLYLPICTVLTFKDGLVVKDYTYYDN